METSKESWVERFLERPLMLGAFGALIFIALCIVWVEGGDVLKTLYREQMLLSCLQEAKNQHAARLCQFNWYPEEE